MDKDIVQMVKILFFTRYRVVESVKWRPSINGFNPFVRFSFQDSVPFMKRHFLSFLVTLAVGVTLLPTSYAATDLDNPSVKLTPEQIPSAVERLIREKKFDTALKYIDEGLTQNPISAQLKFQKSVLYEAQGRFDLAQKELENFIKTFPEIPEAYNNLARYASDRGEYKRAEELLERALALRPSYTTARENLANVYLAQSVQAFKAAAKGGSRSAARRVAALQEILKD
ncbi:MAG TPA: hypothetical protein DD376_01230 [Sutterella sp.]|nr:hypothetical protein [Sutterella sp.]